MIRAAASTGGGRLAAMVAAAATMVAMASPAGASPFEVFGMGSRATAMAGAQGGAARDHAAIYYNPANLTLRRKTHFGLALSWIVPALFIEPRALGEGSAAIVPDNNLGVTLGLNFPLGGRIDYHAALGLAIALPLVRLTRLESIDPARPYFYVYENLPDHLVFAPALGLRVADWLRFGAAVQILAEFRALVDGTGDVLNRRIENRSLEVDLSGTTGVVVGLGSTIGPVDIGLTFRDELSLDYTLPVSFLFEEVGTLILELSGTTLYTPRQLNLGVAVHLDDPALTIAADVTAAFWSAAPDPTARIDAIITDEELRPDEETIGVLFDLHTQPVDLGAQDILIPRVGVEWLIDDVFSVRAGYFHRPAVVPDQSGYSSILDNTANVFSVGAGATFPDPLQVNDEPLYIDLHIQLTALNQRQTIKDPAAGAETEGRLTSGGSIWNLGLEFRQDF